MVGFGGILGIGQVEDQKMIKDKLIDGKKLSRFMTENSGSKDDNCSISPNIRQMLLHQGDELTKKKILSCQIKI